jgi:hypothetical protein
MRRGTVAAVSAVAAVLLAAVAVGLHGRGHSCLFRSVNQHDYIAHNEAVLRTIPLPPGARRINGWTIGVPSPDACVPWHENGAPYSAFVTWHVYSGRGGADFYTHALHDRWRFVGGGPSEATYVRGLNVLYVSDTTEGFMLSMDYQGDAGRGH